MLTLWHNLLQWLFLTFAMKLKFLVWQASHFKICLHFQIHLHLYLLYTPFKAIFISLQLLKKVKLCFPSVAFVHCFLCLKCFLETLLSFAIVLKDRSHYHFLLDRFSSWHITLHDGNPPMLPQHPVHISFYTVIQLLISPPVFPTTLCSWMPGTMS